MWFVLRSPTRPNPVYHDKTLAKWLDEVDPQTMRLKPEASQAVIQIGTNAVPYLVREIGGEDSAPKKWLLRLQRRGFLGPWHIRSENERRDAGFRGILTLQTAALPEVMHGLSNPDKHVRLGSGVALLLIGKHSPEITQALISLLNDKDVGVRCQAMIALALLEDDANVSVPALIPMLNDLNSMIQESAANALAQLREKSKPAVPALLKILANPNVQDADGIIKDSLKKIDPEAAAKNGFN